MKKTLYILAFLAIMFAYYQTNKPQPQQETKQILNTTENIYQVSNINDYSSINSHQTLISTTSLKPDESHITPHTGTTYLINPQTKQTICKIPLIHYILSTGSDEWIGFTKERIYEENRDPTSTAEMDIKEEKVTIKKMKGCETLKSKEILTVNNLNHIRFLAPYSFDSENKHGILLQILHNAYAHHGFHLNQSIAMLNSDDITLYWNTPINEANNFSITDPRPHIIVDWHNKIKEHLIIAFSDKIYILEEATGKIIKEINAPDFLAEQIAENPTPAESPED